MLVMLHVVLKAESLPTDVLEQEVLYMSTVDLKFMNINEICVLQAGRTYPTGMKAASSTTYWLKSERAAT